MARGEDAQGDQRNAGSCREAPVLLGKELLRNREMWSCRIFINRARLRGHCAAQSSAVGSTHLHPHPSYSSGCTSCKQDLVPVWTLDTASLLPWAPFHCGSVSRLTHGFNLGLLRNYMCAHCTHSSTPLVSQTSLSTLSSHTACKFCCDFITHFLTVSINFIFWLCCLSSLPCSTC